MPLGFPVVPDEKKNARIRWLDGRRGRIDQRRCNPLAMSQELIPRLNGTLRVFVAHHCQASQEWKFFREELSRLGATDLRLQLLQERRKVFLQDRALKQQH
jgi:hypothetical protein